MNNVRSLLFRYAVAPRSTGKMETKLARTHGHERRGVSYETPWKFVRPTHRTRHEKKQQKRSSKNTFFPISLFVFGNITRVRHAPLVVRALRYTFSKLN